MKKKTTKKTKELKKVQKCQVCFNEEAKSLMAYKLKNINIVTVCNDGKNSIEEFNKLFS